MSVTAEDGRTSSAEDKCVPARFKHFAHLIASLGGSPLAADWAETGLPAALTELQSEKQRRTWRGPGQVRQHTPFFVGPHGVAWRGEVGRNEKCSLPKIWSMT